MVPESEVFWNPLLETLPREEIVKLQVKKFKRIMKWACEHSKFHGQLYRDAGLEPGDIKTMEDIARVPKVEKNMMQGIQKKEPYPYGDMLCVPLEDVTEFHQTSGTTGQPVYQPDTWEDWEWWA
ncbi:MAG: phenylacetate--CoA ligase family protein, partial [Desulfobacteraceae bacterium]|nr:phenylacetate--CoA ligase family protein [Desulfobacteraceae bacterium]